MITISPNKRQYNVEEGDYHAEFWDHWGNQVGRTEAPRPHIVLNFQGKHYAAIEFLVDHHIRPEVKELLLTPEGQWLRNHIIAVYQLEYPVHNMSGKESQCQFDQESMVDMSQLEEREPK